MASLAGAMHVPIAMFEVHAAVVSVSGGRRGVQDVRKVRLENTGQLKFCVRMWCYGGVCGGKREVRANQREE